MKRSTKANVTRLGALVVFAGIVFASAEIAIPDPQAPPGEVRVLTRPEMEPAMGSIMQPPPEGYSPPIEGEEALEIAWNEEGRPDATSATANLGVLSSTQFGGLKDRPVWQVVYAGVCVKAHGPPDAPGNDGCFASEYYVIIDATTGEFLFAYANEFPGAERTEPSSDSSAGTGSTGATGSTAA